MVCACVYACSVCTVLEIHTLVPRPQDPTCADSRYQDPQGLEPRHPDPQSRASSLWPRPMVAQPSWPLSPDSWSLSLVHWTPVPGSNSLVPSSWPPRSRAPGSRPWLAGTPALTAGGLVRVAVRARSHGDEELGLARRRRHDVRVRGVLHVVSVPRRVQHVERCGERKAP